MKKWKILVPCVFTTCAAAAPIVSCQNTDTKQEHYLVFNGLSKRYTGSEDKGGKSQKISLYDYHDGLYYDVTNDATITTDSNAIHYNKNTNSLYWDEGTPAGQYNFNVKAKVNGSTVSYSSSLSVAPLKGHIALYNVPAYIEGTVGQPGTNSNVLQAWYTDPYTGITTDVSNEAKFVCNRRGASVNENRNIVWDASFSANTYEVVVSAIYQNAVTHDYLTLKINSREAECVVEDFPLEINGTVGQVTYADKPIKVWYTYPDKPITENIADRVNVFFNSWGLSYTNGYVYFEGTRDVVTEETVTASIYFDGSLIATEMFTLNVAPREEGIEIYSGEQESFIGVVGQTDKSIELKVNFLPSQTYLPIDVTISSTFTLTSEKTDEIWFDEENHKIAWSNQLDADIYPFTLTATYEYANKTLTTSHDYALYILPREESVACEPSAVPFEPYTYGSQRLNFSFLNALTWEPVEIEADEVVASYLPDGVYYDQETMILSWYQPSFSYAEASFTIIHNNYYYTINVPIAAQMDFNDATWQQLSLVTKYGLRAVHAVFKENCDTNQDYPGTLIGLSKNIKIGDSTYQATVVGEDYDTLSSSTYEKACLTFMIEMPDKSSTYNDYDRYASSYWCDCKLHGFLNDQIYNSIELSIRQCIKRVQKVTYNERNEPYNSDDYFFIPSLKELNFTTRDIEFYEPYVYFKDNVSSKLMKSSDSIWVRSPVSTGYREHIYYLEKISSGIHEYSGDVWAQARQIVAMFCI